MANLWVLLTALLIGPPIRPLGEAAMKVLFTALVAVSTMCGFAMAQDKSKEVVGSTAKVVLKTTKTMVDKALAYPQSGTPELTMMMVTMQPDGHTSLHKHPSPTAGFVIEGYVEVRADEKVLKVKAGEAFLEPIDGPMQIWNANNEVSKLVVFVAGTEGTAVAAPIK
jgi:quercetin dioxygenase-like cupin family protein